ncbi:hypothetical protein SAMN05444483_1263 [Salegentibacter echinorum]|uniref:Uncharacterized protein n=1 Tax=Salegentibacter echinorum TaxID=1073325 RepID=A0A1M5M9D1_SALEC|nr:hypothetical protein [Salegentibacter echinorum]SHG73858.1 hypothetical protein SAMN05444483_1263 [Salegentibacter echinorum]
MNYIKTLQAAFETFYEDDRLNPSHVSLYLALFQEWNSTRFAKDFYVWRREVMQKAKIGSNSTYHRCLRDLHKWSYITYFPSNNPFKGSKIKMLILEINTELEPVVPRNDAEASKAYSPELEQLAAHYYPNDEPVMNCNPPKNEQATARERPINEQALNHYRPKNGQALVSNINNTKTININKPNDRQAVFNFFEEHGFNAEEGKKFFEYYSANNWRTRDGATVQNWQALAKNWITRSKQYQKRKKAGKSVASLQKSHQDWDHLKTSNTKNYGQPL